MKIAKDKKLHLLAGFILAWTGLIVVKIPLLAALIAGLFWGGFREAINKWGLFYQKRTGWDWADVAYTVVGSLVGGVVLQFTNWQAIVNSSTVYEMVGAATLFWILNALAVVGFIYTWKKK